MALPHAAPGELIDVRPLGDHLRNERTHALFKTDQLEVIRIVLPAGAEHPQHAADGEITVQCLEGSVLLRAMGKTLPMKAGDMLYLKSCEPHSVEAMENASLLVTMLIEHEQKD
jgi:quercetin dioxygenase-like cupin family protein